MAYVPLHVDILENPKIMRLPADAYRFWTLCLLSAQKHDYQGGGLPELDRLAYWTREAEPEAARLLAALAAAGLLDEDEHGWKVHDWEHWQKGGEGSSTPRVRRHREAKKAAKAASDQASQAHPEPVSKQFHQRFNTVSNALPETLHETLPETGVKRPETEAVREGEAPSNGAEVAKSDVLHETFHVTLPETGVKRDVTPILHLTSNISHLASNNNNSNNARGRLGGEPSVSMHGKFVDPDAVPSACTTEEVEELTRLTIQAFGPIGGGDVWVRRVRTFAALYPADWIAGLIPSLASKATDQPDLPESYAAKTLQRWAKAGGPPADFHPSPILGGPPRRAAAPPRPMTDHQRKMARYRERSRELDAIIAAQDAAEQEGGADEHIA